MPKVSKQSAAHVDDHGVVEDRHEDIEGTTVNFLSFREDADITGLLAGLPGDMCPCPHWGYVFSGQVRYRYADREEVFTAGDAFSVSPGHVPFVEAGTEFVQFSPSEELHRVTTTMRANMQKLMRGA